MNINKANNFFLKKISTAIIIYEEIKKSYFIIFFPIIEKRNAFRLRNNKSRFRFISYYNGLIYVDKN